MTYETNAAWIRWMMWRHDREQCYHARIGEVHFKNGGCIRREYPGWQVDRDGRYGTLPRVSDIDRWIVAQSSGLS